MSVMKKILTFFMLLLILCACETRLTDNTDQDIFDFPKYRVGVININTHNYHKHRYAHQLYLIQPQKYEPRPSSTA